MKYLNYLIPVLFIILIIFNIYHTPPEFLHHQILASSISKGDSYYGRLQLWYDFARVGDWDNAARLEAGLDPADLADYKKVNHPDELKKYINTLSVKPGKTVEDWLELARIQAVLGKTRDVTESLLKARNMDPVRDDLSRLYYQSLK